MRVTSPDSHQEARRATAGVAMWVRGAVLVLVALVCVGRSAGAAPTAAERVVDGFESGLIEAMKGRAQSSFEQRFEQLEPIVSGAFDLAYMAQLVAGQRWTVLTPEQRQVFVERFGRLVVAALAAEVGVYSGQSFKLEEQKPLKRGRVLVRSRLTDPDSPPRRFDYVLREGSAGWVIVNLVVDGISDLALKRTEYGGILAEEGFDSLIRRLDDQILRYRAKG